MGVRTLFFEEVGGIVVVVVVVVRVVLDGVWAFLLPEPVLVLTLVVVMIVTVGREVPELGRPLLGLVFSGVVGFSGCSGGWTSLVTCSCSCGSFKGIRTSKIVSARGSAGDGSWPRMIDSGLGDQNR